MTKEMLDILQQPGHLGPDRGAKKLRDMYYEREYDYLPLCIYSTTYLCFIVSMDLDPSLLCDFAVCCFAGILQGVVEVCDFSYLRSRGLKENKTDYRVRAQSRFTRH